jgi:hypothetical protein
MATGVGGGGWHRLGGPRGDALPLSTPGAYHCGMHLGAGWLSGWAAGAHTTRRLHIIPRQGATQPRPRAWSRWPSASTAGPNAST